MFYRGDHVEANETYIFGKTTVRVVAPSAMSDEEKLRRICEMNKAFSNAWKSLPIERQIELNRQYEQKNK